MEDPSPDVVALFRAAPEDFIGARDALSKALRDRGLEDEARAVKGFRKPTVLTWALNQLGDRMPAGVGALLDGGAELRAAQQAALSGSDPERLRVASDARRRAVADLARVAADVLREAGRDPAPHLDNVVAALEAASVDPHSGAELRRGTLERPPQPAVGFGDLAGLTALPGGAAPTPRAAKITSAARDAERRRAQRERATADDLARQVAEATSRLEQLRARHNEAEARAKAADLDARRAERDLPVKT